MSNERGTLSVLLQAFEVAPSLRRGLGLTLSMAAVGTGFQLVVPIVIQQIIDNDILGADQIDVSSVVARGAVALLILAAAASIRGAALVRLVTRGAAGLAELRVRAFRHLHRLSVLHVQAERRGALVARVTSDVETIQRFVQWGGVGMVLGVAQATLAVTAMAIYRWQLAVLIVLTAVMYAMLLLWFQRMLRRQHDRVRATVGASMGTMSEAISGVTVVRAHGAEDSTMDRVRSALTLQFNTEFRTGAFGAALFSSAELFAGLITAIAIAVGVIAGGGWGMSAGTLLAFLFLVNLLVEPVQTLVETLDQAQSAAAGLARILDVLDTEVEIPDPAETGVDPAEGPLDVAVEDLTFRYPTGPDVLRAVSVVLPAGTRVAVVGETGSGKSTFSKLVTRLLDPTEGTISIGSVPLQTIPFATLRRRVAFVPQEGFLFDATVAANIRYGRPEAADEEVMAALEDLGLDDWVAGLPSGVDTPVGERGTNLSAGERQLVALARAWITAPDLLVLDEATSAVDPALEVRLRNAIERVTQGRTSITVAHRLSTAEASDIVLVFDQGELVEMGHHDELLDAGGVYADLQADWVAGVGESS